MIRPNRRPAWWDRVEALNALREARDDVLCLVILTTVWGATEVYVFVERLCSLRRDSR